jgi:ankyrin repeat protein
MADEPHDSHSPLVDNQLIDAADRGDAGRLGALLDAHPEKLTLRKPPYGWTLLHIAAHKGHLTAVDMLLQRGLDVNAREQGDNTYAIHWAASAGHVDVVQRLADAGGDVVGHGDDHELEVIGWATCWDGCDDEAHEKVVDALLRHGARHHIFSAIAMNLADEVRRIVAEDPAALNRRLSRNENNRLPLHHAVVMNRPEMVDLLIDLGADPLATDGDGQPVMAYATSPGTDRRVMEKIRAITLAELSSAQRGHRRPRSGLPYLTALLALRDWDLAERLVREDPRMLAPGGTANGALHLAAKRGDAESVRWLLDHGADPSGLWDHWDASVTPLHLAAWHAHTQVVTMLLDAGADQTIEDSKHHADPLGWADFFNRGEIVAMLKARRPASS